MPEDLLPLVQGARNPGSNRLAVLADEIQRAHNDAVAATQTSVARSRDAGRRLIEAKSLVPSRQWLAWLKTTGINERTARDYMQLARLNDEKAATVAALGLRAALEAIRDETHDEDDPPSPEAEWTDDQLVRKAAAEAGEAVVANLHEDEALLAWAEAEDRLQRIDRTSDFGNPFIIPEDGDRAEVVAKFQKFYWPHKGRLERIHELGGKVLACWCHPQECHGHIIAETVNRVIAGEGTPQEIADHIADSDG